MRRTENDQENNEKYYESLHAPSKKEKKVEKVWKGLDRKVKKSFFNS